MYTYSYNFLPRPPSEPKASVVRRDFEAQLLPVLRLAPPELDGVVAWMLEA